MSFENSGAVFDSQNLKSLLESDDIYYLSEMINFSGVLNEKVITKINLTKALGKPIDGHASLLTGDDLKK